MAINIKPRELIQKVRVAPLALKIIAAVLAADFIFLLLAWLILEDAVDSRAAEVESLKADLAAARSKVDTVRKEVANLPELRKSYEAALADGVLADQDRQKMIGQAQERGDSHRISDLHYKLDPQVTAPLATQAFVLVTTPVYFNQTGALDSDVFEFWQELLGSLQAHYQITKATLERMDGNSVAKTAGAIRDGRPAAMVKSELDFRWISMRKVAPAAPAKAATPPSPAPAADQAATSPVTPRVEAAAASTNTGAKQ